MPIDINEDRRLRVTWCKYNIMIADMKRPHFKSLFINESNCDNRWEAEQLFEEEIRKIEQHRRNEMMKIRKEVREERKMKKEQEAQQKQAEIEERRTKRETLKKQEAASPPPPLRRSARIYRKTAEDTTNFWNRGSFYKTA